MIVNAVELFLILDLFAAGFLVGWVFGEFRRK